jgi:hypothetical protein
LHRINLKVLGLIILAAVFFPAPLTQSASALSLEEIGRELDEFFEIDNTQDNRIKQINENGDNNIYIQQESDFKTKTDTESIVFNGEDDFDSKIHKTGIDGAFKV